MYILKLCDSEKLIGAIGEIVGYKGIVLQSSDIRINVLEYISLEVARENKVVPYAVENGKIKVCFTDNIDNKKICQ